MSSLSFIGRSLLVLLLTHGLMAHAADEDGELRVNSGVTQTTNNRKSAPKIESPRAAGEPEVRVLDKVDVERERLANLVQEVAYLRLQVADAARLAPGATRVQFRYDWLDRDLELIQHGIQEHFDAPRQPRPAPPLKGSYRR